MGTLGIGDEKIPRFASTWLSTGGGGWFDFEGLCARLLVGTGTTPKK